MLSRQLLRERFEEVSELLTLRGTEPGMLDEWRRLDRDRRATLVEVENLKNQRNEASKAIGKIKQGGGDAAEEIAQVASLKGEVEALENRLAAVDGELRHVELRLTQRTRLERPARSGRGRKPGRAGGRHSRRS